MRPNTFRPRAKRLLQSVAFAAVLAFAPAAMAQATPNAAEILRRLEQQESRLAAQAQEIARQRAEIEAQRSELERLRAIDDALAGAMRGAGMQAQADPGAPQQAAAAPVTVPQPPEPVGEGPPPAPPPIVAALPEGVGVLTGTDRIVFEANVDYTRASSNRLVFRGVELAPGVPLGAFEASDVARDTTSVTFTARTGLTNRIEIEARVPYVWRNDRLEFIAQRDETVARVNEINGSGIGDAELTLRYQINRQYRRNIPFTIAALRIKSDTGKGSFDINRDAAGVATKLSTGSGFWGIEPGLSFILPSDEGAIVVYGGASYLFHLEKDVNLRSGDNFISRVDPGDSLGLNLGYGFAINPQFSTSVGYRHNVIFETETTINNTKQRSNVLQVGSLALGMSYRLSPRFTLNASIDVGVTDDAPDVRVAFRTPFTFKR